MILHMDCREGLSLLLDNSVDAIVTDPPYGLSFMGKKWDYDVPDVDIWKACLRVLKPGGHLLAFAGTRTQHRMAVRIEDAGFEIRDMIAWVYGSGFPKHQSCLKPSLEPITMARKPAPRATLLNIDACRVGNDVRYNPPAANANNPNTATGPVHAGGFGMKAGSEGTTVAGRYPANLIHDGSDEVLALFPDSNGSGGSVPNVKISGYGDGVVGTGNAEYLGGERTKVDCGKGSAARFFYCAKASKKDRDEGLEDFPEQKSSVGDNRPCGDFNERLGKTPGIRRNPHPTVKPTELMRYLCRLVTPAGGLIVDPFAGSGSTGKAAALEGFHFIGYEMDEHYVAIANARYEAAKKCL